MLSLAIFLLCTPSAFAQNLPPKPESSAPATGASPSDSDAVSELQKAVTAAGNDRSALARNLQDYLRRFPDSPQKEGMLRVIDQTASYPTCRFNSWSPGSIFL